MSVGIENLHQTHELFSDPQATAAWFGGVLETGAITSIGVAQYRDARGILRDKTQPFVEIHTTSQVMLDRLHTVYGGMRKPRFWNKGGQVAAEIVASTFPFIVARREHALAMQNWLNSDGIEEKIAIARGIQGIVWQQEGEIEAYQALLTNPAFVAGILDSRGYLAIRPAKYYHTLYMQTTSKNLALLNSLQVTFGGRTRMTEHAGTKVNHGSVAFETQVDTHVWEAVGSEAISLVRFASPFLLTHPPEGWDYQRAIEKQGEERELARKIAEQARRELALVQTGELLQLNTNAGLATMFGIGRVRVSQYLEETLTPEELKARYNTIKQYARRSVDAVTARQIVEHIKQEVEAVQNGERDRLSLRVELTELFGVSIKALSRHVIPQLDPATSTARQAILRIQITHDKNLRHWQNQRENQST